MKQKEKNNMFIGIDLGTTNSSITSFDGKETRIWKSPEQNDVTPSVIYINKRGGKMYGQSAYNNEPRDPKNTAKLFKRYMGTKLAHNPIYFLNFLPFFSISLLI